MGVLIGFAVALVIGGVTTFVMVTNARARDHVIAGQTLAQVDKDLDQGDAKKLLDAAEKSISKTFELGRGRLPAMTWLHERVVLGLLKGGRTSPSNDANTPPGKSASGRKARLLYVALPDLFQGDTAGGRGGGGREVGSALRRIRGFQLLAGHLQARAIRVARALLDGGAASRRRWCSPRRSS